MFGESVEVSLNHKVLVLAYRQYFGEAVAGLLNSRADTNEHEDHIMRVPIQDRLSLVRNAKLLAIAMMEHRNQRAKRTMSNTHVRAMDKFTSDVMGELMRSRRRSNANTALSLTESQIVEIVEDTFGIFDIFQEEL